MCTIFFCTCIFLSRNYVLFIQLQGSGMFSLHQQETGPGLLQVSYRLVNLVYRVLSTARKVLFHWWATWHLILWWIPYVPPSLPSLARTCQFLPRVCKAYFSSSNNSNVLAFIQQVKITKTIIIDTFKCKISISLCKCCLTICRDQCV